LPDTGFPPIARADARILILGSMPGQKSLAARQYYAHPQNAFWRIMGELVAADDSYEQRCSALTSNGIALWDVLHRSERPGSMDADIRADQSEINDFQGFFDRHPALSRVGFNGQMAAKLFRQLVDQQLQDTIEHIVVMPSTSAAYASMPYAEKLRRWRDFIKAN